MRRQQANASRFSPDLITSATPRSWHRADSLVTPDTGVGSWGDRFGNGYTLAQATGSKQPTQGATIAGRPALTFARASSQLLTLTNGGLITALAGGNDTAFTVYMVLSAVSLSALLDAPWSIASSASATVYMAPTHGASGEMSYTRRDGGAAQVTTYTGFAHAVGVAALVRWRYSGTAMTLVGNGVTATPSGSSNTGSLSLDRLTIGALFRGAATEANYLDANVAEMITYTGVVSSGDEAQLVSRYFMPLYSGVS